MGAKFTVKAGAALNSALRIAREMGHTYIGTEHILLGLLGEADCIASGVLGSGGVSYESVKGLVRRAAGVGEPTDITAHDMTPKAKKVIEDAARDAAGGKSGYIGTEHLLFAILSEPDCFGCKMISAAGASALSLKAELAIFIDPDQSRREKTATREIKGAPALSKYGVSLVAAAKRGETDPVIGRESECERVMQILSRRTKNNPCLTGEPGVGKTAIVEGLASLIAEGRVPDILKNKDIVALDIPSMIAGAKYRGEFEDRMKSVMEEVRRDRNIILFIDEVHTIMGAGAAEGAVDAANILKPALSRGEIRLIGATTNEEYRRHIERDAALERRLQQVPVREPTPAESVRILEGLRDRYEAHHKLRITDEAIGAAVDLSVRYIKDKYLPDKAIDLIDETASRVRIEAGKTPPELLRIEEMIRDAGAEKKEAILSEDFESAIAVRDTERSLLSEYRRRVEESELEASRETPAVTASDVAETLTKRTGIPVCSPDSADSERLSSLEERLSSVVVGQGEAIGAVCRAVRRGMVGIKDPERPAAVLLFTGPTGVGKTELARQLAAFLFGGREGLVSFDMSEFSEKHSISKLIGSPPGYVGYGDAARLTEAVRRTPCCVLLFDEIEKAHPEVLNLLLRIMEDGRLTDAVGRECDFKNTVMIMTSNVGGEKITSTGCLGFSANAENDHAEKMRKREASEELKKAFRPEFIGRVDEIVIFEKLTPGDLSAVAKKYLTLTSSRLSSIGIEVEFDAAVPAMLASKTDGAKYGARPLRRLASALVDDVIAERIVSGEIKIGDRVFCTVRGDGLAFETMSEEKSAELIESK